LNLATLGDAFNQISVQLEGQVGIPIALAGVLMLLVVDKYVFSHLSLLRSRIVGWFAFALFIYLLLLFGPGSYGSFLGNYDVDPKPLEIPVKLTNTANLASKPFPGGTTATYRSDGTRKRQQQAIVVCIDVSGSMGPNPDNGKAKNPDPLWTIGNDPDRLALLASHLLTDLTSPGEVVGAVFFSGKVVKVVPLTKIDQEQSIVKLKLKTALDSIYNGGTDITAGVLASASLLDGLDKTWGKYIVVLSDMEKDPKNKEVSPSLRDDLHNRDITAFAVGLGDKADLEQMSRVTWEEPYSVHDASELPNVFKGILGKVWDTREVPQTQNESGDFVFQPFLPIAKEVNFIVSDQDIESLKLDLVKPDGASLTTAELSTKGNYAGADRRYRTFKISRPDQLGKGKWTLRVNRNPGQVSFMQVLDLAIQAQFDFDFPKREIRVSDARLVNLSDGSPYNNPEFYGSNSHFDLVVQNAGQKEATFPLASKAEGQFVFQGDGTFDSPGSYQFFVRFTNDVTSVRSEIFTFSFTETNTAELAGPPEALRMGSGTSKKIVFKPTSDSTNQTQRLRFVPNLDGIDQIRHQGKYLSVGGVKDKDQLQLQAARFGLGQSASTGGHLQIPVTLHGQTVFQVPLDVDVGPSPGDLLNLLAFLAFEVLCGVLALRVLWKLVSGNFFPPGMRFYGGKRNDHGKPLANKWFSWGKSRYGSGGFQLTPAGRQVFDRKARVKGPDGRSKELSKTPAVTLFGRSAYGSDTWESGTQHFYYGLGLRGSRTVHQQRVKAREDQGISSTTP